jgi:Ca2+-binding RTX toxin-like protein
VATYNFTAITAAQALALTGADTVLVPSGSASATTILFIPGAPDAISMTVGATTVVFSAALSNATITYADSSRLYVGTTANDAPAAFGAEVNGLYGGLGADTLSGGNGMNQLQGNQGNDSLVGGQDNDVIYGGQDNDYLNVGSRFSGAPGGNFAQGNRGSDTVIGSSTENDILLGGQDNDMIGATSRGPVTVIAGFNFFLSPVAAGHGGNDFLNGNLGDDFLFGGAGADQLFGEDGNDYLTDVGNGTLNGGAGSDILIANGISTVDAGEGADIALFGPGAFNVDMGGGNDITGTLLNPIASDRFTLSGGAGNDDITTSAGSDIVNGGDGSDTIDAAGGADTISGGEGLDAFSFYGGESFAVFETLDQIIDWTSLDVLYFEDGNTGFGIGLGNPSNYAETTAASYAAAQAFANARVGGGAIDYVAVQVGGDVFVFADALNNNGVADVAVRLVGRSLADISQLNFTI